MGSGKQGRKHGTRLRRFQIQLHRPPVLVNILAFGGNQPILEIKGQCHLTPSRPIQEDKNPRPDVLIRGAQKPRHLGIRHADCQGAQSLINMLRPTRARSHGLRTLLRLSCSFPLLSSGTSPDQGKRTRDDNDNASRFHDSRPPQAESLCHRSPTNRPHRRRDQIGVSIIHLAAVGVDNLFQTRIVAVHGRSDILTTRGPSFIPHASSPPANLRDLRTTDYVPSPGSSSSSPSSLSRSANRSSSLSRRHSRGRSISR